MRGMVFICCGVCLLQAAAFAPCRAMTAEPRTFDIPRLDGVAIDGKASDWGERGLRVDALKPIGFDAKHTGDFDARFRLGWNDDGLLLLAFVTDDKWLEGVKDDALWRGDSIEIYLAPGHGDEDMCQWIIAPGMAEGQPAPRWFMADHRKDPALKGLPAEIKVARKASSANSCIIEAFLPWSALAVKPEAGRTVGFQLWFNDADDPKAADAHHVAWYEGLRTFRIFSNMHSLRLSEKAGPAELLYPTGRIMLGENAARFYLTGAASLAGGKVKVMNGDRELAGAVLSPDRYERASCHVMTPLPPFGEKYDLLTVTVDGKYATRVSIGDYDESRVMSLDAMAPVAAAWVIDRPVFPEFRAADAGKVAGLMGGPFEIETRFHDASFTNVIAPSAPGRYGAVVRLKAKSGAGISYRASLFYTGGGDPAGLMAPGIAEKHGAEIEAALKARDARSAILLAGLYEAGRGGNPPLPDTPRARDDAWWSELNARTGFMESRYRYLVFKPEGYDADEGRRWPVLVYLHGGGLLGGSFESFRHEGLPACLADGKTFPCIVVVPHSRRGYWVPQWIAGLMDEVRFKFRVDPDRFYVAGHSLGGKGAASFAAAYPHRIAAMAFMGCGGPLRESFRDIKHIPLWVFNGESERTSVLESAERTVRDLNALGGRGKNTVLKGAGHGCEGRVLSDDEFRDWLAGQRRVFAAEPQNVLGAAAPKD